MITSYLDVTSFQPKTCLSEGRLQFAKNMFPELTSFWQFVNTLIPVARFAPAARAAQSVRSLARPCPGALVL